MSKNVKQVTVKNKIRTFNQYWAEANQEIIDQAEYEHVKDAALQPKDRTAAFQHYAGLYVRYVQIFKKIDVNISLIGIIRQLMIKLYILKKDDLSRTCWWLH